jgi:hypothetical protein
MMAILAPASARPPPPFAASSSAPGSETGSATGFYQEVRYLGFSLGSALTASILASHTHPGNPCQPEAATRWCSGPEWLSVPPPPRWPGTSPPVAGDQTRARTSQTTSNSPKRTLNSAQPGSSCQSGPDGRPRQPPAWPANTAHQAVDLSCQQVIHPPANARGTGDGPRHSGER